MQRKNIILYYLNFCDSASVPSAHGSCWELQTLVNGVHKRAMSNALIGIQLQVVRKLIFPFSSHADLDMVQMKEGS